MRSNMADMRRCIESEMIKKTENRSVLKWRRRLHSEIETLAGSTIYVDESKYLDT